MNENTHHLEPDMQNQRRDIESIQRSLRTLAQEDKRIPSLNVDGLFGPETAASVKAFQRISGLPVTGSVDFATWEALADAYQTVVFRYSAALPVPLFPSPDAVLMSGDTGDAVYTVQLMINGIGQNFQNLPHLEITGRYDRETLKAVESFQQLFQLPVTGQVDKVTWDALTVSYTAR